MKDKDNIKTMSIAPKRIRTYLIFNVVLAVLLAVIMTVRSELRTGHYLLIDVFLITFYSAVLASIFIAPFGIVEIYLYRRKKGAWYEWKKQTRRRRRDPLMSQEERQFWKSEAYRARQSQDLQFPADNRDRTGLFEQKNMGDAVSRAALLMTVADNFEQSGKREAAERCYLQITQRFPESTQAKEATRRLAVSTND